MTYGQFLDHNSALVAHTNLKTKMGSNRLARQSFDISALLVHSDLAAYILYQCHLLCTIPDILIIYDEQMFKSSKDIQVSY